MSGETGLRERKKQRMYRTISETAISLFLKRGFDQVSVADVAAAAEVSKPTLFRYFPAKEDLVLHRFADHEDEAGRVVRGRPAEQSPLAALHQHFLAGLDRRDPITGLSDEAGVLAFHRLLYGTPSLVARLFEYTSRSEEALTTALGATGGPDDLAPRLAAGQIIAVQRILALDNWRRIEGGASAEAIYPGAVAAADRAFTMLRTGLAPYAG
ncbi:TetR/AcrR family transcriptional regulator [Streptomyces sp. ME19-01-6]|uniref:TetR/AcrR family transcriptional regulator n=1 Tax=Streptomyces sp. ME19-01-6 TaxID=3028686 RepID=UPI0029BD7E16|nr:TetR family transcriptional regulator [Streptomyces sp. ME19-01-6]MDX3227691.1 TetR family transcriptional regulator [Streptomyces sp. ME19-01-6]